MSFIQAQIKNTRQLVPLDKLSATVITVNQVLANDGAGNVGPATSGTTSALVEGIANQSIAAADALTQVLAIKTAAGDTWIADTTNNSNVAHNYQKMVLTDSLTVNNTGTTNTSGIVEQVDVYGATTDKKIIVRFV